MQMSCDCAAHYRSIYVHTTRVCACVFNIYAAAAGHCANIVQIRHGAARVKALLSA